MLDSHSFIIPAHNSSKLSVFSMIQNHYIRDASEIFKSISRDLVQENLKTDLDYRKAVTFFAFGLEKLFKGILYDINPAFTLQNLSFNNALFCLYKDKIKLRKVSKSSNDKSDYNKYIERITDNNKKNNLCNTIGMSACIERMRLISHSVQKHEGDIYNIVNMRDDIAHCNTGIARDSISSIEDTLKRSFFVILKDIKDEFKEGHSLGGTLGMFDNFTDQLAAISAPLQKKLEDQVKLSITSRYESWNRNKGYPTYKATENQRQVETDSLLASDETSRVKCPSCKSDAILYFQHKTEFNSIYQQEIIVGRENKKIECLFCELSFESPEEIGYALSLNESDEQIC